MSSSNSLVLSKTLKFVSFYPYIGKTDILREILCRNPSDQTVISSGFFYCFKNSVCLLPKQLVYFFILIVCSEYPKLYNYFSHNFNKNFRNFEILLSILVTLVIIFTLKWTIIGNYFFLFSNYFPMILKISMSWFFPHDFL